MIISEKLSKSSMKTLNFEKHTSAKNLIAEIPVYIAFFT